MKPKRLLHVTRMVQDATSSSNLPDIKMPGQRMQSLKRQPSLNSLSYKIDSTVAKIPTNRGPHSRLDEGPTQKYNLPGAQQFSVSASPKATREPSVIRPETSLATLVRTAKEAKRAADFLYTLSRNIHACDTETTGVDPTEESPVGKGRVICLSIYSGPVVDFSAVGETIEVRNAPDPVTPINSTSARELSAADGPDAATVSTAAATATDGAPRRRRSARLWVDTNGPEKDGVWAALRPWLEDARAKKVWHNYGFDRHVLANCGVAAGGFWGDTLHMARLWDSSRMLQGGYSLSALSNDLLGWGKQDLKAVFGRGRLKKNGEPGKLLVMPDPEEIQV